MDTTATRHGAHHDRSSDDQGDPLLPRPPPTGRTDDPGGTAGRVVPHGPAYRRRGEFRNKNAVVRPLSGWSGPPSGVFRRRQACVSPADQHAEGVIVPSRGQAEGVPPRGKRPSTPRGRRASPESPGSKTTSSGWCGRAVAPEIHRATWLATGCSRTRRAARRASRYRPPRRDPMRDQTPPLARRLTTATRLRARGLQGGPQPPLRSRHRTEAEVIRESRWQSRSSKVIERAVSRAPVRESLTLTMHAGVCAVTVRASWPRERRGAEAPPCNPPRGWRIPGVPWRATHRSRTRRADEPTSPEVLSARRRTPCAKTPPLARRLTTATFMRARGLQGGPQPPLRSRPRTKVIRIQGHPRSIRVLGRHRASERAHNRAWTSQ